MGHVLLAEPDPSVRSQTAARLRSAGHDVTAVDTATAAHSALGEGTDCVVTAADLGDTTSESDADTSGVGLLALARKRRSDVGCVLFADAGVGDIESDHDVLADVVDRRAPGALDRLAGIVDRATIDRSHASFPVPDDEAERSAMAAGYDPVDGPTRAALDRLTTLATSLFDVPAASVSAVTDTAQTVLSCRGVDLDVIPREGTVCTFAILDDDVTVVEDLREDPRFSDLDVIDDPGIVAYAGAPMVNADGHTVGTFCLYDHRPRSFDADERTDLQRFADEAMEQLDLRRQLANGGTRSDG